MDKNERKIDIVKTNRFNFISVFNSYEFQKLNEQLEHIFLRANEIPISMELQNKFQDSYEKRIKIKRLIELFNIVKKAHGNNNKMACKTLLLEADREHLFIDPTEEKYDLEILTLRLEDTIIKLIIDFGFDIHSLFKKIVDEVVFTDELRELVRIIYLFKQTCDSFIEGSSDERKEHLDIVRRNLIYI